MENENKFGCPCGSADSCNWLAKDMLVHEIIDAQVHRFPKAAAVEVVTDSSLRASTTSHVATDIYTYNEINSMANTLANRYTYTYMYIYMYTYVNKYIYIYVYTHIREATDT